MTNSDKAVSTFGQVADKNRGAAVQQVFVCRPLTQTHANDEPKQQLLLVAPCSVLVSLLSAAVEESPGISEEGRNLKSVHILALE